MLAAAPGKGVQLHPAALAPPNRWVSQLKVTGEKGAGAGGRHRGAIPKPESFAPALLAAIRREMLPPHHMI